MIGFTPVLPIGGLAGWQFLQNTRPQQEEVLERNPVLAREVAHFEERIGQIETAEELVSDRTLLTVALGAFGLQDDINNTFFIQRILEDGSFSQDSLANRLSDKRYLEFTQAFGFGDLSIPRTKISTFAGEITEAYKTSSFEVAVGNVNGDFRLAMSLDRELSKIASDDLSDRAKWFTVMGNPPLRTVFERAYSLPTAFGALDLEQQLEVFEERTQRSFGASDISQFADKENRDELVRQFLVQSQLQAGVQQGFGPGQTALALLSGAF